MERKSVELFISPPPPLLLCPFVHFSSIKKISPAMAEEFLATEMDTAVRVVHLASSLCVKVQDKLRLPSSTNGHVKSKDDDSPVTVAGSFFSLPHPDGGFSGLDVRSNCGLLQFEIPFGFFWVYSVKCLQILVTELN